MGQNWWVFEGVWVTPLTPIFLKSAPSILRFHIVRNLQYLIFRLLEGFGANTVLSCKNGPMNCPLYQYFVHIPKWKSLFLKINFSSICYDILNKITISQCPILNIFAQELRWKNSHWKKQKINFDLLRQLVPLTPFRCVETHIFHTSCRLTIICYFAYNVH